MDLRAGRLAQHSRHPVDSESCSTVCADKLVARGVVKGGFKDDVESTVANCWRAPEPSTCRSFAVTCSGGASGHPAELTSTWTTEKLRIQRRGLIAIDPLRNGAVGLVAEPVAGPARFP